ncbi:MAG: hypothetical protein R3F59_01945 [Myxococcota bacterium]
MLLTSIVWGTAALAAPPDRYATCDEQAAWFTDQQRPRPDERPDLWWIERDAPCPFETSLVGDGPPAGRAIGCEDRNGRRYGWRTEFGDGGKVAVQSHWEGNREDGTRTEWDPVTYDVLRVTTVRDGRTDGEVVEWLDDGGVLVTSYRRSDRDGPTWRLDARGEVVMVEWYRGNQRHGRSCAWKRGVGGMVLSVDQVFSGGEPE